MRVRTRSDLEKLSADGMSTLYPSRLKISVGMATCGLARVVLISRSLPPAASATASRNRWWTCGCRTGGASSTPG
jgi:hypothetical protein